MSGLVNIGGSPDDATYRYKMPRLRIKIEGSGNGIKTVIPNMSDVAKALKCSPAYPTKFFGVELGAQSNYDKATDRAVVNGAFTAKDLSGLLTKFIDIFVLCPNCRLPEITLKVKRDIIKVECAACGHNGVLPTTHKLVTYIINNPPTVKKKLGGSKSVETKSASSKSSKLKKGVEEEVVWFTDTSKEAAEARRAEELRAMGHAVDLRDRVDAILTSSTVGEVSTGDDAALVTLQKFIEENKDINEIVGEVHRLSLAKSMSTDERFALMVNGLLNFEKPKLLISQIEQYAEALRSFAATPDDASRLMSVFEKNIGVEHPKLLPKFAVVLQALYENDVFEDEAILNWYNSPVETSWAVSRSVAEELRSSAKPFIDWLNSEDGEDESDFE